MKRRQYSDEEKSELVRRSFKGESLMEISQKLEFIIS